MEEGGRSRDESSRWWKDGGMDGWTSGWMIDGDIQMDEGKNRPMDGWMD